MQLIIRIVFFFFNDTATTEIYTLSLHDALPISSVSPPLALWPAILGLHARQRQLRKRRRGGDRKSTRLNSSHQIISYAVFCLKKKKNSHGMNQLQTKKNKTKQS